MAMSMPKCIHRRACTIGSRTRSRAGCQATYPTQESEIAEGYPIRTNLISKNIREFRSRPFRPLEALDMNLRHLLNGFLAMVILVASFPMRTTAKELPVQPDLSPEFVAGEILIGFSQGPGKASYQAEAASAASVIGAEVVGIAPKGVALLRIGNGRDVGSAVKRLARLPGIRFAEPNYIFRLPEVQNRSDENKPSPDFVVRPIPVGMKAPGQQWIKLSVASLQAMTKGSGSSSSTYPNDRSLWYNWGWDFTGASIVWPNAQPSSGVCVLDTGVDYQHPDLEGRVLLGYDFVSGDDDPMDDNGHGTHVAGIIAANTNNGVGIAGASTGTVTAVKVLGAQGWGTSWDIALGIEYCADHPEVKVLNLSLGGPASTRILEAITYAVNIKGKLIVAAAGNGNSSSRNVSFPAGYAVHKAFWNKVLAVAASDMWDDRGLGCKAAYSNYGSWISIVAPGTDIYSTLPWKKPYTLQRNEYHPGYGYLSGTSMATPFVSAAAARRWGYTVSASNSAVGVSVKTQGRQINNDGNCWPQYMRGARHVNIAALLNRGASWGSAFDATTGHPLVGAQVNINQTVSGQEVLRGSGIITPYIYVDPFTGDEHYNFTSYADILNLPAGDGYTGSIIHPGYTLGEQAAFRHAASRNVVAGSWSYLGRAVVPQVSENFAVVAGSHYSGQDLDLYVWLPEAPNPQDSSQPSSFIVGWGGDDFGRLDGSSLGAMTTFPYARYVRDSWGDWTGVDTTLIRSREEHGSLAANPRQLYYPGTYIAALTDYGQMVGGQSLLSLSGASMYVWRNGVILRFLRQTGDCTNNHWWKALQINSGISGQASFTNLNVCGDFPTIYPYPGSSSSGLIADPVSK